MKKVKIVMLVSAFALAIGAAAAPTAVKKMKDSKFLTGYYPQGSCTSSRDCPNTGSQFCGYASSGCSGSFYTFN
jgi:hypothetical protein